MTKIVLTKFEVAERQLLQAINMFFREDDPVSIQTLAEAANQVLHDNCHIPHQVHRGIRHLFLLIFRLVNLAGLGHYYLNDNLPLSCCNKIQLSCLFPQTKIHYQSTKYFLLVYFSWCSSGLTLTLISILYDLSISSR